MPCRCRWRPSRRICRHSAAATTSPPIPKAGRCTRNGSAWKWVCTTRPGSASATSATRCGAPAGWWSIPASTICNGVANRHSTTCASTPRWANASTCAPSTTPSWRSVRCRCRCCSSRSTISSPKAASRPTPTKSPASRPDHRGAARQQANAAPTPALTSLYPCVAVAGPLQAVAGSRPMSSTGKFHRQLSLTDLTFIGLGAIFGSGWLFAASHVSAIAGPAGILSWLIGGAAVLLLGLVYCELGAALPRAGGVVRYPEYSHGRLLGSLMGLIAIETVACRQYAAAWFPALNRDASGAPTLLGWLVQLALLTLFFALNYFSVKTFARANNLVSIFKFLVPLLVIVVLLSHFQPQNMSLHGFAPYGFSGVEGAVSAGGVIFAYLGLTPIISVASEVRDPQRTIPIALILSVLLSTANYLLLQVAFLGSIPTHMLAQGWGGIGAMFSLPYHDIAITLGIGWLAALVVCDAAISPSGTGNIYMNATPRVVYGWA